MQTMWRVTWHDGCRLRELVVQSDIYNLITAANAESKGMFNPYSIIKIERLPSP